MGVGPPSRVLVIGGSGYLGSRVASALRANPVLTTMTVSRRAGPNPAAAHAMQADLTDPAAMRRALDGADYVVNAMMGSPAAMIRVAENLARHAGPRIRRIVHVSSLAVYGTAEIRGDELTSPPCQGLGAYAAAKCRCERLLLQEPAVARRTLILRPGCLYGVGAPQWIGGIGRLLMLGKLGGLAGQGEGASYALHVDDMTASVMRALRMPPETAGIFNVIAPEKLTWNTYFMWLAEGLGIDPGRPVSRLALAAETWVAGFARQALAKLAGGKADAVTPAMRRLFRSRARISSQRPGLMAGHRFVPHHSGIQQAAAALLRETGSTTRHMEPGRHTIHAQESAS